jgi:hypothetical protein
MWKERMKTSTVDQRLSWKYKLTKKKKKLGRTFSERQRESIPCLAKERDDEKKEQK